MKHKIIFILLLIPSLSFSQYKSSFKNGIYKNIEELKTNYPSYDWDVDLVNVDMTETVDTLGINYKLHFPGREIKLRFINDSIFCIVKDSVIYMNTPHFSAQGKYFQKVLIRSDKLYRYIASYNNFNSAGAIIGGALFGAGGAMLGGTTSTYKRWALVKTDTGEFFDLDDKSDMVRLLFNTNHDLYIEYKNLKNHSNFNEVIKIIDKYDQK